MALGDFFNNAFNWIGDTFFGGSYKTNETNKQIAQENIEYQKWANEQNIAFTKQENEITRQREDTAVQRAAADMTAAGFSKTLAAGQPASAAALSPPQVEAPNNSFQMQRNLAGLEAMQMMKNLYFDSQSNKRANELNDAQVGLIEAQTAKQNLENETFIENFTNEQALKIANTEQSKALKSYYVAQARIGDITGDNLQRQIDTDIAYKSQLKLESASHLILNAQSAEKARKEIELLAEDIATEILKQDYMKAQTETEKERLLSLIKDQAKAQIEIDALKIDIEYAQSHGLPVGKMPGGVFGQLVNLGDLMNGLSHTGVDLFQLEDYVPPSKGFSYAW